MSKPTLDRKVPAAESSNHRAGLRRDELLPGETTDDLGTNTPSASGAAAGGMASGGMGGTNSGDGSIDDVEIDVKARLVS